MSKIKSYIDFLNVGFGECTFLNLNTKNGVFRILVDCGDFDKSTYEKRECRISLEEYIEKNNIIKIDLVILTHFHVDHIGGLYRVLNNIEIKEVILNIPLNQKFINSNFECYYTPFLTSLSIYKSILKKLNDKNIVINTVLLASEIKIDKWYIKFFTPKSEILNEVSRRLSILTLNDIDPFANQEELVKIDRMLNNSTLAVSLKKDKQNIALISSDAPISFWNNYEEDIADTMIMQSPHHGDAYCISKDLLETINPKYFIISADSFGKYNLPHDFIDEKVEAYSNAEIYYTDDSFNEHSIIRLELVENNKGIVETKLKIIKN